MLAIDRVLYPKYKQALEEGPGNHFFDFMLDEGGKHPSTEERVRNYLKTVLETMRRESGVGTMAEKKILSDDSAETKATRAFIAKKLKPGERVILFPLTGQGKDKNRAVMLRAMQKKATAARKKKIPPWDSLRVTIEAVDNPKDPNAVVVFVWWKHKSGEWKRHQIGFLKRTHLGKEVNHNKVARQLLESQAVKRVRYKKFPEAKAADDFFTCYKVYVLRIFAPSDTNTVSLKLALVCDMTAEVKVPSDLPSYYRDPETEKIGAGPTQRTAKKAATKKKAPKESAKPPVTEAPPQTIEVRDWPSVEQLAELMELLSEHEQFFFHAEEVDGRKGILAPVAVHEWRGTPKKLKSAAKIEEAAMQARLGEFYGDFLHTVNLQEIQDEFGIIMAENFYKITGGFAGPMDKLHVQSMIVTMRRIVKVLREFQGLGDE